MQLQNEPIAEQHGPSLGDTAGSGTAVVAVQPEPGAPEPPAAAAQPPPAGRTAQDTPVLDSGGAASAAVATAAEVLKSKPAAELITAAGLADLKTLNHKESGSAGGAGGPGNAKGPPAAAQKPKPPTAMEKEQKMPGTLLSIRDRANELLKHDLEPPAYLIDVVRLHCANPAFGAFCTAILTMFPCHGRPQVVLEQHKISGIILDVDKAERTEFRAFIK